jgi:hypothetical protein
MSDTKHEDAKLIGFTGPIFYGLEGIQRLYKGPSNNLNANFLKHVLSKLPNHDEELANGVETSDGTTRYQWAHAMFFNFEGHRIALLLPGMLHVTKDGSCSDRHVALYYQGPKASQRVTTSIAMKLFSEFTKAYFIKYGIIL